MIVSEERPKEKLSFALSKEWRKEFCRAAVEKIRRAASSEHAGPANDATREFSKAAYHIGDVLPDGWVVGGVSPDTHKPFSIEPISGALEGYQTWYKGEDHAKTLQEQGNLNARQPTADELNVIYNDVVQATHNDNAKLNVGCSAPYSEYWSSMTHPGGPDTARVQYLEDGYRGWHYKAGADARARCVRDEPGLTLA